MFTNTVCTSNGDISDWGFNGGQTIAKGGFLSGTTQEEDENMHTRSFNSSDTRRYEGSHLFPLKIGNILTSLKNYAFEQRVEFLDYEVIMFKLVGLVSQLSIDEQSEKWSFALIDDTGTIAVEWLAHRLRDCTEIEPSPWMKEQLAKIKNNVYVRVCGDINLLGKTKPHVSAFIVSAIEIPEEIFYHDLQLYTAILNHSQTERTGSNVAKQALGAKEIAPPLSANDSNMNSSFLSSNIPSTPSYAVSIQSETFSYSVNPKISLYAQTVDNLADQSYNKTSAGSLQLDEVARVILEIMRNIVKLKPQGLTVQDLMNQLVGRGIGVSEETVEKRCKLLTQDGLISVDNSGHYKIVQL